MAGYGSSSQRKKARRDRLLWIIAVVVFLTLAALAMWVWVRTVAGSGYGAGRVEHSLDDPPTSESLPEDYPAALLPNGLSPFRPSPEGEEGTVSETPLETVSEPETEEDKLTISKKELDVLIASAVASALAKTAPQIVQVAPTENPVVLLFLGGIMPGSTVALGELGNIYRDGGTLTVSKENFFSKLNGTAEYMLRTRQLIVVSGLTDEERERYGVLYNEKELLNEKTYGRLLSYSPEELKTIYVSLCPEHKAIAAKAFRTAIDNQDGRVTEEKLKLLAKADKEAGVKDSTFKAMLAMFAPETEE